jgi:hypothetical protein
MNRKLKAPPKLTNQELEILGNHLLMADWHFDATIKKKCTEISSHSIYWEEEGDSDWVYAIVFGLQAVRVDSQEPCIANIFIRYKHRVYQVYDIVKAANIIQLLKKEQQNEEFKDKLWHLKDKKRQQVIAEKRKGKARIKKLRIASKKEAA